MSASQDYLDRILGKRITKDSPIEERRFNNLGYSPPKLVSPQSTPRATPKPVTPITIPTRAREQQPTYVTPTKPVATPFNDMILSKATAPQFITPRKSIEQQRMEQNIASTGRTEQEIIASGREIFNRLQTQATQQKLADIGRPTALKPIKTVQDLLPETGRQAGFQRGVAKTFLPDTSFETPQTGFLGKSIEQKTIQDPKGVKGAEIAGQLVGTALQYMTVSKAIAPLIKTAGFTGAKALMAKQGADLLVDNIVQLPGEVIDSIKNDKSIDEDLKDIAIRNVIDIGFNAVMGIPEMVKLYKTAKAKGVSDAILNDSLSKLPANQRMEILKQAEVKTNLEFETPKEIKSVFEQDFVPRRTKHIGKELDVDVSAQDYLKQTDDLVKGVAEDMDKQATEAYYKSFETPQPKASKKLFHGTNKEFAEFDINKSFASRNEKLGAGEAIYFSEVEDVAKKYADANSNASFNKDVFNQVKNPNDKKLMKDIYENGYEEGWAKFIKESDLDIGSDSFESSFTINPNNISDIVPFIRGANVEKTGDSFDLFAKSTSSTVHPNIINDAKMLGITDVPGKKRIIERTLSPNAKIKEVGFVSDAKGEALKAKTEGYDGIRFTTDKSVDNSPEVAIFNKNVISESAQIEPPKELFPEQELFRGKPLTPQVSKPLQPQIPQIPQVTKEVQVKPIEPLKVEASKIEAPSIELPSARVEVPQVKTSTLEPSAEKLRQTIHNSLMESELPEEMKQFFKDNPAIYEQVSNKETWETSIKNVADDFEGTLNKFNSKDSLESATDTGEAIALLHQLSKTNITDANKLALDLSEKATKSGQAIQAIVMLQKNTPEGKLVQAHNVIKNAKKALEEDLPSAFKDLERKGKLPELTDADAKFITDKMKQAQDATGREREILISEVDQLIADKIPATFGDKIRALRNLSLLGNFKTIGTRNPLGNVIFGGLENIAQIPSGITDAMLSKVLKSTRQTPVLPSIKKQVKGFKKGFGEAVSDIKLNIDTSPTRGGIEIPRNRKVFEIAWLNKANNWLGDALKLGDRPFYQAAYDMRLSELKKLQPNASKEDLETLANEFALQRVFQNDSKTSQMLQGFKNSLNSANLKRAGIDYGLGDVAMPYTQTPANILAKSAEYTPLNLINIAGIALGGTKGKTAGVGKIAKNIEMNQKQFTDAIGRMFTGSGILALGYGLAKNGDITGKRKEKGKAKQLSTDVGERDYSIKIGDTWHSYDWAQPAAMPLAVGVDAYNAGLTEEEFLNKVQKGIISGGNTMLEQSLLRGLTNMFGGQYSSPAEGIADTIFNAPTQFSPTFGSQVAQFTDPYKRDVNYDVPTIQTKESIQRRTPVLRQQLRPQVDILGNPKLEQQGRKGLERAFDVFFNPSIKSPETDNPVLKEVKRLHDKTGEADVIPSYTPKGLTRDEEYDFKVAYGQEAERLIKNAIKNPSYKNKSDEEKAKFISKVLRDLKTTTKKKLGYE